jgi:hypothetical protein
MRASEAQSRVVTGYRAAVGYPYWETKPISTTYSFNDENSRIARLESVSVKELEVALDGATGKREDGALGCGDHLQAKAVCTDDSRAA